MTGKEGSGIGQDQAAKWQKYPHADRSWWTPHYPDKVATALQVAGIPQEIGVLGVGAGYDAVAYAEIPGVRVVGFDLNKASIAHANATNLRGNISYEVANVAGKRFARGREEAFGVITAVGLVTNIIDNNTLIDVMMNVEKMLAVGGSLIISDYGQAAFDTPEFWRQRYERDRKALAAVYGPTFPRDDYEGAFVVRPYGLSAEEAINLSQSEIEEALRDKNTYERLAKHWNVEQIVYSLYIAGYFDLKEIAIEQMEDGTWHYSMVWQKTRRIGLGDPGIENMMIGYPEVEERVQRVKAQLLRAQVRGSFAAQRIRE